MTQQKYDIINLEPANTTSTVLESLGTKRKHWVIRPGDTSWWKKCLFKIGRENTGENWAEKVAAEICRLLGLPHAHYELAVFGNLKGVLSPSFVGRDERLILGNELLAQYKREGNKGYYRERHHNVHRVMSVAERVGSPSTTTLHPDLECGADFFVGYLMLDALIANQDRHDENWGIIIDASGKFRLAPTYDHASSLGRITPDAERMDRLSGRNPQRTVETFLVKSRSAFFRSQSDSKPLGTIEAFLEGAKRRRAAARYWLHCLLSTDLKDMRDIFLRIPESEITNLGIEFGVKILELNKANLEKTWSELK